MAKGTVVSTVDNFSFCRIHGKKNWNEPKCEKFFPKSVGNHWVVRDEDRYNLDSSKFKMNL
jgi:hypothetical protein